MASVAFKCALPLASVYAIAFGKIFASSFTVLLYSSSCLESNLPDSLALFNLSYLAMTSSKLFPYLLNCSMDLSTF
ncbi:MAG: hypothetical protein L0I85_02300 [Staphylococcus equorum]|nr:hypothetical protein [Staphylococcus equorum]